MLGSLGVYNCKNTFDRVQDRRLIFPFPPLPRLDRSCGVTDNGLWWLLRVQRVVWIEEVNVEVRDCLSRLSFVKC